MPVGAGCHGAGASLHPSTGVVISGAPHWFLGKSLYWCLILPATQGPCRLEVESARTVDGVHPQCARFRGCTICWHAKTDERFRGDARLIRRQRGRPRGRGVPGPVRGRGRPHCARERAGGGQAGRIAAAVVQRRPGARRGWPPLRPRASARQPAAAPRCGAPPLYMNFFVAAATFLRLCAPCS